MALAGKRAERKETDVDRKEGKPPGFTAGARTEDIVAELAVRVNECPAVCPQLQQPPPPKPHAMVKIHTCRHAAQGSGTVREKEERREQ